MCEAIGVGFGGLCGKNLGSFAAFGGEGWGGQVISVALKVAFVGLWAWQLKLAVSGSLHGRARMKEESGPEKGARERTWRGLHIL